MKSSQCFLVLLSCLFSIQATDSNAQHATYLNYDPDDPNVKIEIRDSLEYKIESVHLSNVLISETRYKEFEGILYEEGVKKTWYPTGEIKTIGQYHRGILVWVFQQFHQNGQLKRKELYGGGNLVKGHCYDEAGNEIDFCQYFKQPELPGGQRGYIRHMGKNTIYPRKARRKKQEGRVVISAIVGKDGRLSLLEIAKSVTPELDAAALNAVRLLPKFTPAMLENQPVRTTVHIPIVFSLTGN